MRRGPRSFLVALALVALASGCAAPVARVTRGDTLATGDTLFDDFFSAVRDVRTEALAAQRDEQASHAGFLKALGLDAKASSSSAVDESGLRAKRLSDKGVLLHLEIAPDARLLTVKAKWDPGPDGDALFHAVEEAARGSLEMRRRLASVALRAAELERRRVTLRAQAPATFRDAAQSKREEVAFELDASQAVLTDAGERATNATGAAARFVVELAQAVETGAGTVDAARLARGGRRPAAPTPLPQVQVVVAAATPAPPRPAPVSAPASAPAKPAPAPRPAAAPAQAKPAVAAAPTKKKPKGGGDDFEP